MPTEILISQAARLVLDAALRLKAGSLSPHQRRPAFWGRARVPSKIILGDEVTYNKDWSDGQNAVYDRSAEVWGFIDHSKEKCLARFELRATVQRHLRPGVEPPDDDAQWHICDVRYLCVVPNGDGSWKESEESVDFAPSVSFLEY